MQNTQGGSTMQFTRREALAGGAAAGVAVGLASIVEGTQMQPPGHVVLLGDSIFDNKPYVGNGPAVIDLLRKALPQGWKATLLAVDGSIAGQVPLQLENVPTDATHLFVSAGGNDALQQQDVLQKRVTSVEQALGELATLRERFEQTYAKMLTALLKMKKPSAICTIYDPNFPVAAQQRVYVSALAVYNDCITRAAARHHLPLLDLRVLFDDPADYANPIEPSVAGGRKLAAHITAIVQKHDFSGKHAVVYGA